MTRQALKQVSFRTFNLSVQVAFTGLARAANYNTREWLVRSLEQAPVDISLDQLVTRIADAGTSAMRQIRGFYRFLTVVMLAMVERKARIAVISNFEWPGSPTLRNPMGRLEAHILKPTKPRVVIAGQARTVSRMKRRHLLAAVRANRPPDAIRNLLAAANANVAADPRFANTVSASCYVHSILPDGARTGMNVGATAGIPDMIFMGVNAGEWARKNLRPVPGHQVTLDAVSGVWFPKTQDH
jgi:hypothetical protein